MKQRTLLLLGFAGLSLAGLTAVQAGRLSPAPEAPAAAAPRRIAAEGRVAAYPGAQVMVAAERQGRLVAVLVDQGSRVERGQLLAELDSDELRAALAEARARVAEAEAELRLADADLGRKRELVDARVLAARELDAAARDREAWSARRDTYRAETERLVAQLKKCRITAPLAGTVIERQRHPGETLAQGDVVVTLADLGRLRVEGEVDEADAGVVTLGGAVTLTSDAFPGQVWRGRIEEVGEVVRTRRLKIDDPTRPSDIRVLPVKVAFVEPTPLKLGTTVELKLANLF